MTTVAAPSDQLAPAESAPRPGLASILRSPQNAIGLVSSVLLPLGLVLILLGWYGAARTPNLFEQIPYMISGGLLGLALVIGSALFYFGSWVAQTSNEQRVHDAEVLGVLREIREELQRRPDPVVAAAVAETARPPRQRGRAATATPSANGHAPTGLVATAAGSMIHRPDCAVVASREDVRAVEPNEPGLKPCRMCAPLDAATGSIRL